MKNKKFNNSSLSLTLYFLRTSRLYFLISIVCVCFVNFLALIIPKIISYTIDTVINNKPSELPGFINSMIEAAGGIRILREHLYYIAAAIVITALISALFQYLNGYYNAKASESLVETMRNDIFSHIGKLPFSFHSANNTGDIIQRCTSDVDAVKNFLSEQLVEIFRTVILVVFSLYFMAGINLKLTLIAVILLPVSAVYSTYAHKKMGKVFEEADIEEGKVSSAVQENLTGVRVVRAFGREKFERDKFEKQNGFYHAMWVRLDLILSAFWAVGDFISGIQVMSIITFGAYLAVKGELNAGDYLAFIYYNSMLTWPIRSLGRAVSGLSRMGIALNRIKYILDSPTEDNGGKNLTPPMDEDIVFENVSFSHIPENKVLDNVSFTVKKGSTLGILGGTGSGKSTLMYLLTRLYELPEGDGRITVGGIDIKDINLTWLRKNIGMVLQEPYLFSGTISENIAMGKNSSENFEIESAADTASLSDTIREFKDGFSTYVGERGVTLSGGQKQRVAIARTVISESPVMIFDDSLSAVDAETDSKIRHALSKKSKDSTVMIISHRITTLMSADKIIVLDNGKICESGTHDELIANNGIYRKIYDIQFGSYETERRG